MEVHTITRDGESLVILLDNKMRPVKPVNEFLRFQYGKYRDLYVPMSLVKELDDFVMNERQSCGEACEYNFVDENKHKHYGTAIVSARVRHPQDKSLAEGTVKLRLLQEENLLIFT